MSDHLTPLRQAVRDAQVKMDNAVGYPAWRNAQADYNEAREQLRDREYQLDPEACDAHHAALAATPHYFLEA
jgi:hypothetical protein